MRAKSRTSHQSTKQEWNQTGFLQRTSSTLNHSSWITPARWKVNTTRIDASKSANFIARVSKTEAINCAITQTSRVNVHPSAMRTESHWNNALVHASGSNMGEPDVLRAQRTQQWQRTGGARHIPAGPVPLSVCRFASQSERATGLHSRSEGVERDRISKSTVRRESPRQLDNPPNETPPNFMGPGSCHDQTKLRSQTPCGTDKTTNKSGEASSSTMLSDFTTPLN